MQVNFNQDNVCNPLNSLGDPFKLLSIIIHYCVCVNVWWQEWQTHTHIQKLQHPPHLIHEN